MIREMALRVCQKSKGKYTTPVLTSGVLDELDDFDSFCGKSAAVSSSLYQGMPLHVGLLMYRDVYHGTIGGGWSGCAGH